MPNLSASTGGKLLGTNPKWRAGSDAPSIMNIFMFLSGVIIEEEMSPLIDDDRGKMITHMEKVKSDQVVKAVLF
jgi:hypothetical protein